MSELLTRAAKALSFPVGASTLELGAPWALLLLALPLLAYAVLPPYKERQPALRVPFFERVAAGLRQEPEPGAVVLRKVLLEWVMAPLVFGLLVVAAARPELVLPAIQKTESARDLLLAVDISTSMNTRDFTDPQGRKVERLDAVKGVLHDFIARRQGDRIGLLVFGEAPHLQAPFTLDHDLCRELLGDVQVGMAGPRTMIGDAIGLAIKLFEKSQARQKVVVLLTDGNDTGSRVPPTKAAEIAKSHGITIHTVGVGDPATKGADIVDAGTLAAVARDTGGETFMALDRAQLEGIYGKLDEIEKVDLKTASYRPRRPLFQWPLGAAVCLLLLFYTVMTGTRLLRERHA
ncbi:MAG TPA: VWA domain-containing protein [Vicinamibacteria bacterium]|nr:VWA domain-containing protein [Vicinamibacteria bacterium]